MVNAEKVAFSGKKWQDKTYYRHTGYVGGLKEMTAEELRDRQPEEIIRKAVKGMLARGPSGEHSSKKLKVYVGAEHPHDAQQAEVLDLNAQ